MIRGYCHTNLDDYQREEWPKEFVALPRVGDCVRSSSGKILKICRITHRITTDHTDQYAVGRPEIDVELHKVIGG